METHKDSAGYIFKMDAPFLFLYCQSKVLVQFALMMAKTIIFLLTQQLMVL